jgi:AraC-like DNA-binding protein
MIEPVQERSDFWRHPRFHDLGLMRARFTRHRYDLHTHPTYVVALITDGCERIRVGGHSVVAPAGTLAIVNPEQLHDGEAGAEGGWAYLTFYPSVSLLTEIARELGQDRAPQFGHSLVEDGDLARAIAVAHADSMAGDAVRAEASMLVALRRLILRHGDWTSRPVPIERSGSRRRLLLYADVIEGNLVSDLDLERLAQTAGVTRFQVIRDFKKEVGLTPAAFIRNRRLHRAGSLIEQGSALADAALAAGFSDQSHMSRTFRAVHGITPGMFQKAWLR